MHEMAVRFVLNGSSVEATATAPHVTLLQWLRGQGLCGTREGCAEGECGACAVALVVSEPGEAGCHFQAVNSCLLPLASLEGRELVSVEGVAPSEAGLHPVQQALVEAGGSQCGFCTPGFVVSLFCEYYRAGRTAFDPESISGNLCRCTGYRPIVDAARGLGAPAVTDPRLLQLRRPAQPLPRVAATRFVRPTSLAEACRLARTALPIAGGTDLMVEANQRHRRFESLLSLEAVPELQELSSSPAELVLGAGVTLARLERWLGEHAPDVELLHQLWPLFSSRLIRNRATLGGNLATASPIGDSAPALLALDASLTLVSDAGSRRVPLAEFFTAYRQTKLTPGELIRSVHIPRPLPTFQRFYKVSKRTLDDISTVAAGFALTLDEQGKVTRLGVGLGGVAATPLVAPSLSRLAVNQPWNETTLALLLREAAGLGTPQSDLRGSAEYRRAMLGKLLEKFFYDSGAAAEAAR
jgi:xanthine dehydrogenase small subunit